MTDYYLDVAEILDDVASELEALNKVVSKITAKLANDIAIAHGILQDLATDSGSSDPAPNTLRLIKPTDINDGKGT